MDSIKLAQKMTSKNFAYIQTVIYNNIIEEDGELVFKPVIDKLRFTNNDTKRNGGWSVEGLQYYTDMVNEDIRLKKEYNKKYKNVEERPDYFNYEIEVKPCKKE